MDCVKWRDVTPIPSRSLRSLIDWVDWVVVLIYAGVVIAFGILAGKKESTTEDYFLGGRKMPWFSVMISINK